MTDTVPDTPVALDSIEGWINLYAELTERATELEESRKAAREHIEAALGEAETGTVGGVPRVRWTRVVTTRLDQRKAKEALATLGVLDQVQVTSESRRFQLIEQDA